MKSVIRVLFLLVTTAILASSCKKDKTNKVPHADAGAAQTIQLPVDYVTVTGTGTDEDGTVVGYLWSEVSGPNAATIINPGSPSTKIKGMVEGTYVFQLMVTDDLGATGLDTMSVKVKPSPIQTISLQPTNNPTEVHVQGNNTNEESSTPGAPEVGASYWTRNGNPIGQRGLMKFDLNTIPATATILSAKLTLFSNPTPLNGDLIHANYGSDNTMLIQRVTSNWTASLVRWTNQPTTTTTDQIVIPHTSQPFLDLVDVDVKNLVQSMVTGSANYGFMIRLQTEVIYNSRIFGSSFYSDASKHPKLVVTYQ